jgi:maltose alpha-D-glucosyltransferase/alpha-amylase
MVIAGEDARLSLCEASSSEEVWHELLRLVAERARVAGRFGELVGIQTDRFASWRDVAAESRATVHGGEQSNTSATLNEALIVKLFRRVSLGVNPDYEIGRKLTDESELRIPAVVGAVEYQRASGETSTVALVNEYVDNVGDAWEFTQDELRRYFESVAAEPKQPLLAMGLGQAKTLQVTDAPLVAPTDEAEDAVGPYLYSAELLGHRTADLHLALASDNRDPAFKPEPFTWLYQRGVYQSLRNQVGATLELLRSHQPRLSADAQELAELLLNRKDDLIGSISCMLRQKLSGLRIRCHGDLHLGQVLFTGKDFVIIDFEGEPARPISERRIKTSPLRDVAGMMQSFYYASQVALHNSMPPSPSDGSRNLATQWSLRWHKVVAHRFLQTYVRKAAEGNFLPSDESQIHAVLTAYLVEKALYELRYELNSRPDWAAIPLKGLLQMLDGDLTDAAVSR